jgi:hypothetical protein
MPVMGCRARRVLVLLVLVTAARAGAAQDGSPADMVADAVRDRGHPCAQVVSAQRDAAASRPDEAVWILTCSDGSYRVRFKGDTGPQVERLN